jgi:L-seryl-tRNA(Ser) seleniumtransferase
VEDLGSGLLWPAPDPLAGEPSVAQALQAGVAAVTWSGDKLLGGPQAGLVAGQGEPVGAMRRNPLYRALRVDKMTLTALDAVLAEHEAERADRTVPVRRMLALDAETLHRRASAFVAHLGPECPGFRLGLLKGRSVVGGGSAPGVTLPTTLVTIAHQTLGAARISALLRAGNPPVVARVAERLLLLDLRTVPEEEETALGQAIRALTRP